MNVDKKLICLYEKKLEDFSYDPYKKNIEELLEELHEIEYKIYKFIDYFNQFNKKFLKNIIVKFVNIFLNNYDDVIQKEFLYAFQKWLDEHPIYDPDKWAEVVLQDAKENYYNDSNFVKEVSRGVFEGNTLTQKDFVKYIDFDYVKKDLNFEFRNDIENIFLYISENKVKDLISKEFNFNKILNYSYNDLIDFLNDNEEISEYLISYVLSNLDIEDFDIEFLSQYITDDVILKAIKNELYPKYINFYGEDLFNIVDEVEKIIEKLKNTDKYVLELDNLLEKLIDFDINDDDEYNTKFKNFLIKIYDKISKIMVVVTLSLNINHYNGNILIDYLYISNEFMDKLSNRNVSDWDKEIKELIRN